MSKPSSAEWCMEERCRHRHWRSGSMPTHRRGDDCPPESRPVTVREGQAEAWDEGFEVGTEAGGRWAENGGPDNDDRNPYRNGEGQ